MSLCLEENYKKIYFNLSEPLRNFIFYKSGNLALAEDVVHDAFIKLWENCKKVSVEKSKSYVYTVANNLFLNKVSHNKVVLNFEKNHPVKSSVNDPQYIMEEEEFRTKLEKGISELPEKQRVVFLMNRIDKKKYKEIAEELGIGIKAVEKRMHKALESLRKLHRKI